VAGAGGTPRSAAVLGRPVEHSLSTVLHGAAYRALGLDGWTYERIDCDAEQLPTLVDSSPGDRIGYSVTMPGKFAAVGHASVVSDRARVVGSADTLVRPAVGCGTTAGRRVPGGCCGARGAGWGRLRAPHRAGLRAPPCHRRCGGGGGGAWGVEGGGCRRRGAVLNSLLGIQYGCILTLGFFY